MSGRGQTAPPALHVEGGWRDPVASATPRPLVRHDCEPAVVISLMSPILAGGGSAGIWVPGHTLIHRRLSGSFGLNAIAPPATQAPPQPG